MKIYTKTGDNGETGLFGGARVGKDSARIAAYGEIDELNAVLGLCRSVLKKFSRRGKQRKKFQEFEEMLHSLQRRLFNLGADLATPRQDPEQKVLHQDVPRGRQLKIPRVSAREVVQLEKWIDEIDRHVAPLKNFILPRGSLLACHLQIARGVARRAERAIVALAKKEDIGTEVMRFSNRLSDLLFMMARYANTLEKVEEEKWGQFNF